MRSAWREFSVSGKRGGFSGTLKSSFNMTESTTQAYSLGTHTLEYQFCSLTLPSDLTGLQGTHFKADLENASVNPADRFDA